MRYKHPVIHALGNTIHKENIEVAGNFVILYKAVCMQDGKYLNLYGDHTEYVLGETYKRKNGKERGFFLGPKDFVSKMYYARWAWHSKDMAVLKCLVPIPAATFHNHARYKSMNSAGRLDAHDPHHEIETNKFQPFEDVTLEILEGLKDYLCEVQQSYKEKYMMSSTKETARSVKGLDYA